MDLILIITAVFIVLSIVCFIVLYNRGVRKDRQIFDNYLEQQRQLKYSRRRRGAKWSKKDIGFFN